MWILHSLLLLTIWFDFNEAQSQSLEQVLCSFVIFKEGDRSPVINYQDDPNNAVWRSKSFGEMTEMGKEKMYEFGRYLKMRYSQKLVSSRIEKQVKVHSFKYDRSIVTARKVLDGFLSSYSKRQSESFPILPLDGALDLGTEETNTDCPLFKKEFNKYVREDREFSLMAKESEPYIRRIQQHSDCGFESIADLKRCIDPLLCEEAEGLKLPNWCDGSCYDSLKTIYEKQLDAEGNSPRMLNLKLQPLIELVIGRLREFARRARDQFQIYMISALEDTIPLIMKACDVSTLTPQIPEFGASVILELKQMTGSYFVNMFYRTPQTSMLKKLSIKGCGMDCELTKFIQIVPPILKRTRFSCNI